MDPKQTHIDFWQQFWEFISKYGAWVGWVFLGLLGRFSYDLLRNKKFTRAYIMGCTGMAFLCGYVGGSYILDAYPNRASIFIPLITLLSNNLISAFMAIDWPAAMQRDWKGAFEILFKNKK